MYKFRYILIPLVSIFAASCSQKEQDLMTVDDSVRIGITLNIEVNSGMRLSSRAEDNNTDQNTAPRRLMSWDGQQSINDMRIYVFSSDTPHGQYLYAGGGEQSDGSYKVSLFNNSTPWTPNLSQADNQKFESHVFDFIPKLRKGKYYKFLALGRDDYNGTEIPTRPVAYIPWGTKTLSNPDVKVGETDMHDMMLENMLRFTHYPFVVTEIFSGFATYIDAAGNVQEDYIYVDGKRSGFQKDIMLKRAVAGLWVYVTDIPTIAIDNSGREDYDGERFHPDELTIHLTTGTRHLNLFTTKKHNDDCYGNAIQVGYIDFSNQYGGLEDFGWFKNDNSLYWQRHEVDNFRGVKIAANSALITNYLMPLSTEYFTDEQPTLTLQLREYETDYVFTRKVRCHITSVTDPVTGETSPYTGNGYQFPILANCLYTIGLPDAPYSLSHMSSRSDDDLDLEMTVMEY